MDSATNDTFENIAGMLRHERRARGMTQSEFAEYLGVSRAYVIQLESGRPTKHLARLSSALQLLGMDLRAVKR